MEFDFEDLGEAQRYKLMTSTITPRPIAWVTTKSGDGLNNTAPYSFFNMISVDPPLVVLGFMARPDGTHKDSAANILETKEFVVNLVRFADAEAMNFTSIDGPPGFDEAAHWKKLTLIPSSLVRPDRIETAPVSMECRLYRSVAAGLTTIVLGQVLRFHIDDALIDTERLYVDTPRLDLVARMHGSGWYAHKADMFQLSRPSFAAWSADTD